VIIIWRFTGSRVMSQTAEHRAQKLVAVQFFVLAPYVAVESIRSLVGGAYLMWLAIKADRGLLFALAGAVALAGYGAVAALQPEAHFGRVLAAYGGVFIVGSLLWGVVFDGFRPDRYDIAGATVCLIGVAVMMYAPRAAD
jgi:small multidrug resistance family-3 protein